MRGAGIDYSAATLGDFSLPLGRTQFGRTKWQV